MLIKERSLEKQKPVFVLNEYFTTTPSPAWTTAPGVTATTSGGVLNVVRTGSGPLWTAQTITLVAGTTYTFTFDFNSACGGVFEAGLLLGTTPPPLFTPIVLSSGTHSFTFTPTTSGLYTFGVRRQPPLAGACSFTLDNVKIYSLTASSDYRYGFQAQEKDDEVKGEGNSLNFTHRMHDPRIGRFFCVDPLVKKIIEFSPYHFDKNSPVYNKEIEGLEGIPGTTTGYINGGVVFGLGAKDKFAEFQGFNLTMGLGTQITPKVAGSVGVSATFGFEGFVNNLKTLDISANVLFGAGDNLDFRHDVSLLGGSSQPFLERNVGLADGKFAGGGVKMDWKLEKINLKYTSGMQMNFQTEAFTVGLVGAYSERDQQFIGTTSNPNQTTSPLTGNALKANYIGGDFVLGYSFDTKSFAYEVGAFRQGRRANFFSESELLKLNRPHKGTLMFGARTDDQLWVGAGSFPGIKFSASWAVPFAITKKDLTKRSDEGGGKATVGGGTGTNQ